MDIFIRMALLLIFALILSNNCSFIYGHQSDAPNFGTTDLSTLFTGLKSVYSKKDSHNDSDEHRNNNMTFREESSDLNSSATVQTISDNPETNRKETFVKPTTDVVVTANILETFGAITVKDTTTLSNIAPTEQNKPVRKDVGQNLDGAFPVNLRFYAQNVGCNLSYTSMSRLVNRTLYHTDEILYLLKCKPDHGQQWNFDDFRNAADGMPDNSYNIALDIECNYIGEVGLPWPMRANHLRYLSVDKCGIHDFYREFFNESINTIPDTISYFRINDPAIYLSVDELIKLLRYSNTNMTKASTCGPEHAHAWHLQNFTYAFTGQPRELELNKTEENVVTKEGKKYFKNLLKEKRISCNYDNLKIFDRSRSKTLEAKMIEKMIKDGKYPELKVFNMSDTMLLEIPDKLKDWRLHFPKLKVLDLRYNNISEFKSVTDHGRADEDPSTGVIDLRNNNITAVSYRTLRTMRHHHRVKVDIRSNPINCICEMRDFVNYLKNPNNNLTKGANVSKYLYFKDLSCANPPSLRGRRVVSLSDEDLGCEIEIPTIEKGPTIALSFMFVMLVFVVFLFIRYREELTILAFTRLNIIFPCNVTADHEENKKYDAFVAYSQHDARWVVDVLRPRLEKPNNGTPFDLCLHHRDFEVGAAISDNIIDSVKQSRHTILVLSRRFLQSEWCLMEFRTAFHQSLLERKKHLIIVLLEKIPEAEIDLDLKRCLKTLTYVEYDDNLFWDKLIYALSNKKRNKKRHNNNNDINMNDIDPEVGHM